MGDYRHVSRGNRCVLCGGVTDCRTHATGRIHCRRAPTDSPPADYAFIGHDKQGFGMFVPAAARQGGLADWAEKQRRINAWLRDDEKKPSERKPSKVTGLFERVFAGRRPLKDKEREWLTQCHLWVPDHVLDDLDVQAWDDDPSHELCFTFPEKDAGGRVIGYTRRYADGSKKNVGKRGLTLPPNWMPSDPQIPLLLVEGASDVAACMAMELFAVGRPSNKGGVELLIELLREFAAEDWPIIVVGENDQKPGGLWPGREGAEHVASRLAAAWERPVSVAYPPKECKDTREWLTKCGTGRGMRLTNEWAKIAGERLLDYYRRNATPFGGRTGTRDPATHDRPAGPIISDRWYLQPDYMPAEMPPRVSLARCPTPLGILFCHQEEPRDRLLLFCCRQHKCPFCGPELRAHWIKTTDVALFGHKQEFGRDAEVFVYFIEQKHWANAAGMIRKSRGNFLRVHVNGEGTFLVCATHEPPPAIPDSRLRKLQCDAARDKVESQIRMIPLANNKRTFTTSHGWALPDPDKIWANWKRLGATHVELADARAVLRERSASIREVSAKVGLGGDSERGPLGNWYGIEWDHGNFDVEHVRAEVREGALLPVTDWDEAATGKSVEAVAAELLGGDWFMPAAPAGRI